MSFLELKSVKKLEEYVNKNIENLILSKLFDDEDRVKKMSAEISLKDTIMYFDYSKTHSNDKIEELLREITREVKLEELKKRLHNGEELNVTEKRSVLHFALRAKKDEKFMYNKANIVPEVYKVLDQMKDLSDKLHAGELLGYSGKPIDTIVNIGIGGSDLGPRLCVRALGFYAPMRLKIKFVSNIDGTDITEALEGLDRERTIFVIVSKTFTTQETITNTRHARGWFLEKTDDDQAIIKHFIAITCNVEAAIEFGIEKQNIFAFWDWVGGRTSLWSAVGLSISLYLGFDRFRELLDGAREMDEHFFNTEWDVCTRLAMRSVFYSTFLNVQTHAILPYEQYLEYLPDYLQQLIMESNGKSVTSDGKPCNYHTSLIVWGNTETNGQHSFHQLLHQGTRRVLSEFLVAKESLNPVGDQHNFLIANCIAQSEALMVGCGGTQHEACSGNRPSVTILYDRLTPYVLGALIAHYEHRVFVEGVVYGINSYDQFGVQLGKKLFKDAFKEIRNGPSNNHDSSTNELIRRLSEV